MILNEGDITISDGGFGVMIAGAIENKGTIMARIGKIALAGGDKVRIEFVDLNRDLARQRPALIKDLKNVIHGSGE